MELKRLVIVMLTAATLLAGGLAVAGDDDKAPAYRIYIDPETGKYTTEDPLTPPDPQPVVAARQYRAGSTDDAQDQSASSLLSIAALVALLAGGVLLYRRQPTT